MRLSHLTDKNLLFDTKNLALSERGATTKILHHLKEIDRRKLFSDVQCSSLFDYCVRELGYSEPSAQRRIVAARMLAEIPEIDKKIEEGALTLSNISQVNQFFKQSSTEDKKRVLEQVEGLSKKHCEKKLFELSGKEVPTKESKKRVSDDSIQVAIVLKDETIKALDHLKALLGQDLSMDDLLQFAVKAAIARVERDKFKQTEKPRTVLSPTKVARVIPASVKREVFQRDKKCVNCGSTHRLNFDHRRPYALGGNNLKENIRLLCFQCNQRSRIRAGLTAPG